MEVEWLSCEQQMPPPDVMVWLGIPGELRGLAYLDGWECDCWWLGDDESVPLSYATHWAEADLPDPPLPDREGNEVKQWPEPHPKEEQDDQE